MRTELIVLTLLSSPVMAQSGNPLPQPEKTVVRKDATSPTAAYRVDSEYKKKFLESEKKARELEAQLSALREGSQTSQPASPPAIAQGGDKASTESIFDEVRKQISFGTASALSPDSGEQNGNPQNQAASPKPRQKTARPRKVVGIGTSSAGQTAGQFSSKPLVFAVSSMPAQDSQTQAADYATTVIPLGSYVKAKVMTGVEANMLEPYPILLQLDHAFVGPNKTRIDLSHCFMIAKARANLSTERVLGETQEISCVRDNGEAVKRKATGYLAGEDSTFGLAGELISRQGQVLGAAVIASLAKGAGEAVALANTSKEVVSGGFGAVATSEAIKNKQEFILGRAASEAGGMIAQWYLDYARQLVPSIAIGSGRDVWIVMLDSVPIPALTAN
ncbi:MAG TPA: TraB/VirB10 family protein [Oligoflexus sp.]|uniref:TraB/VirB10 family protein n=1 Tax=Oligoflexus sp. TaxID=1971216 RepID=UPI002D35D848|nr:TraB/VirB10 family protein [Oligoflexus sp.]HYX31595.1 TraB/VirB10 family protein [Oligoflexus sp.]